MRAVGCDVDLGGFFVRFVPIFILLMDGLAVVLLPRLMLGKKKL